MTVRIIPPSKSRQPEFKENSWFWKMDPNNLGLVPYLIKVLNNDVRLSPLEGLMLVPYFIKVLNNDLRLSPLEGLMSTSPR